MSENAAVLVAVVVVGAAAWWALRETPDLGIDANWINEAAEPDYAPDLLDYGYQAVESATDLFTGQNDMNGNLPAFLQALRHGEGTSGPNGYRTLFGGMLFSSFADHPARLGWGGGKLSDAQCAGAGFGPGCVSTAAGAFQINKPTWNRVAPLIGATDFSEAAQDAAAIHLISEKGALADVLAGRAELAAYKVRKIWASLPGAGYAGQRTVGISTFLAQYEQAGGILA